MSWSYVTTMRGFIEGTYLIEIINSNSDEIILLFYRRRDRDSKVHCIGRVTQPEENKTKLQTLRL